MARASQEAKGLRVPGAAGTGAPTDTVRRDQPLNEFAQRAARSTCPILITGETGVGKGHLARWIHANSPLADGPIVPVNCGAIPEGIVDSQLFGHAKGAFSGATADHLGLVRAAEHGTLFLDEVGLLPPSAQTRLLRLLQDREVQPVGHPRPLIVDVRVIAATNSDLAEEVTEKRFREDLLFRLDVIRLHVKPLRERVNEIEDLTATFNRELAELYRQPQLDFDDEAMTVLRSYHWPGNIRQLRTVIERLHVLCPEERITAARLVEIGQLQDAVNTASIVPRSLDEVRYEEVRRVLEDSGGSVSQTAAVFGVHRSTIYRWLRNHGEPPTA